MMVNYLNRKNEVKQAFVTPHALQRFVSRYRAAYPFFCEDKPNFFNDDTLRAINLGKGEVIFQTIFANANKVPRSAFSKLDQKRSRKRGGDSVRYRCRPFDFVIKDGTVITVELCTARELNKV